MIPASVARRSRPAGLVGRCHALSVAPQDEYPPPRDGAPLARATNAANVNDTLLFEWPFLATRAVLARIRTVFADQGYDAERHRDLCRRCRVEPRPFDLRRGEAT